MALFTRWIRPFCRRRSYFRHCECDGECISRRTLSRQGVARPPHQSAYRDDGNRSSDDLLHDSPTPLTFSLQAIEFIDPRANDADTCSPIEQSSLASVNTPAPKLHLHIPDPPYGQTTPVARVPCRARSIFRLPSLSPRYLAAGSIPQQPSGESPLIIVSHC